MYLSLCCFIFIRFFTLLLCFQIYLILFDLICKRWCWCWCWWWHWHFPVFVRVAVDCHWCSMSAAAGRPVGTNHFHFHDRSFHSRPTGFSLKLPCVPQLARARVPVRGHLHGERIVGVRSAGVRDGRQPFRDSNNGCIVDTLCRVFAM